MKRLDREGTRFLLFSVKKVGQKRKALIMKYLSIFLFINIYLHARKHQVNRKFEQIYSKVQIWPIINLAHEVN